MKLELSEEEAMKFIEEIKKNDNLSFLIPLATTMEQKKIKDLAAIEKAKKCSHVYEHDDLMCPCSKCGLLLRSKNKSFADWKETYTLEFC